MDNLIKPILFSNKLLNKMISNQKGKVSKGGNSKKEPKTIKTTAKTVTNQSKQSDLESEQKVVKYTLRNGKMEEITAAFEKHVSIKDNEEEKTAEPSPFGKPFLYFG